MLRHVLDLLYSHRTHGYIRTIENAELRDRLTAEHIRGLEMRGLIDNYFLAEYQCVDHACRRAHGLSLGHLRTHFNGDTVASTLIADIDHLFVEMKHPS